MKKREKENLINLYERRYEKYGNDVRTVGWRDVETQRLRFDVLCDIANLTGKSICDIGCGFGDLYSYLIERYGHVNYHGIDLSKKLIAEAKCKYPGISFKIMDVLNADYVGLYDYILCSGALNFKIEDNEAYINKMLCQMMRMAKEGVAVNFLSSYVDYSLDKNFHFSPEIAFSMGKRITPYVTLRHDYPLYEFTLYLHHDVPKGDTIKA